MNQLFSPKNQLRKIGLCVRGGFAGCAHLLLLGQRNHRSDNDLGVWTGGGGQEMLEHFLIENSPERRELENRGLRKI
jgi:hypothetical protein